MSGFTMPTRTDQKPTATGISCLKQEHLWSEADHTYCGSPR